MGSIAVNENATYNVVSSSHVFPFTCWQEVALDSSWVSEACHDVQGAMFGIYAPSITKQSLPRVAVFELLLLGELPADQIQFAMDCCVVRTNWTASEFAYCLWVKIDHIYPA